ncbi:uncharacterized protein LOC143681678 [Tamandua tetradactyla]|uniref:uncharacterized protein LOC143681678 n=1 Tax=Tamandua tetradactyla TaxID=48850 RepID=UPI00405436B4
MRDAGLLRGQSRGAAEVGAILEEDARAPPARVNCSACPRCRVSLLALCVLPRDASGQWFLSSAARESHRESKAQGAAGQPNPVLGVGRRRRSLLKLARGSSGRQRLGTTPPGVVGAAAGAAARQALRPGPALRTRRSAAYNAPNSASTWHLPDSLEQR